MFCVYAALYFASFTKRLDFGFLIHKLRGNTEIKACTEFKPWVILICFGFCIFKMEMPITSTS